MRKNIFTLVLVLAFTSLSLAQVSQLERYNNSAQDHSDPAVAWYNDPGCRTVTFAGDMDQDGKAEFVATDYTNGGRVHVLEYTGTGELELVWSSPVQELGAGSGSTPRWVRVGDMDGDGNSEILFPSSYSETIQIFEWDGTDNGYGATPAFQIYPDIFPNDEGLRFNREQGTLYDFDGDGRSELITSGSVSRKYIYVIGITGSFPGFANATVEGGLGTQNAADFGSTGSMWHSPFGDFDGDGNLEILNHHWDFLAYWGIEVNGPDSYSYPDLSGGTADQIYKKVLPDDAVNYMGVQVLDVDGDGQDEFGGVIWGGASDGSDTYDLWLHQLPAGTDIRYAFGDLVSGKISDRDEINDLVGKTTEVWGVGAADLNGNGRDEFLLGGLYGENVVAVEYNGTGSIFESANYTKTLYYTNGPEEMWGTISYYDSAGVAIDTTYEAPPFVSKMEAGMDVDGDGNLEIAISYQTVFDSLTTINYTWDDGASDYVAVDTTVTYNDNIVNVRLLEYGTTGIEVRDLSVVTPDDYKLEQNYPNPFNPETTIRFSLPLEKNISLTVYDMLGREVKTLIDNEDFSKGSFEVVWDGTNNANERVSSGTYIYTLKYGNFSKSLKMSLLK